MGHETARVTRLIVYPVKSMKGIGLQRAKLTPQGLEHDRRYMVVREDGRFVTQRDLPRLALVETHLDNGAVSLSMDGHGRIGIDESASTQRLIDTRVWGDHCRTVDLGNPIAQWLTSSLESESPLRLVRMADGFTRPQSQPEDLGPDTHTFFADAAPFLLANEASLSALNRALEERALNAVPMNRFRPNIVVDGLRPFSEHVVSGLQAAEFSLSLCHACERCVVTTIDQETAVKDPDRQPFRTLREINPIPGKKPAPAFGQNAILGAGAGRSIRVDDTLEVLTS